MSDGTRTHDRLDHNQELYQLSYAHRGIVESTSVESGDDARPASWDGSAATSAGSHSGASGPMNGSGACKRSLRCGAERITLGSGGVIAVGGAGQLLPPSV